MLKHQRKGKRKEGKKGERKGKLLFHKLQSLSGGQTATLQAQTDLPKNPTQIRDAAAEVWETRNYFNYNYKCQGIPTEKAPFMCPQHTGDKAHFRGTVTFNSGVLFELPAFGGATHNKFLSFWTFSFLSKQMALFLFKWFLFWLWRILSCLWDALIQTLLKKKNQDPPPSTLIKRREREKINSVCL